LVGRHIEEWTVTTQGELAAGFPRHYIRINPTHPDAPDPHADPNATDDPSCQWRDSVPRGTWSAAIFFISCGSAFALRTIQSCVDSIEVIDRVLKRDLHKAGMASLQSRRLREKDDGSAFDGTGVGRCWADLTGGTRSLRSGCRRDPILFIKARRTLPTRRMIGEQLWDADDLQAAG